LLSPVYLTTLTGKIHRRDKLRGTLVKPQSRQTLFLRIARETRGATAVEFAMLVVPLMAFILGSLQLMVIFFAGQALQSAATAAGRQLMVGSAQKAGLTQAQFHSAVCADAPSLFQCGAIMVDVQSAASYSSVSTTAPTVTYDAKGAVTNTWSYSPGSPGDVVILRVMYDWPVVGGPLAPGLANQSNGTHLLVATTVIKDEPYQ
jgi:Flp pilus assembly protein TadG